jgi:hypothetical protein
MQTSDAHVPSLDRVQLTLNVDIAYAISRMKVLERLPGNPIGINYRWFFGRLFDSDNRVYSRAAVSAPPVIGAGMFNADLGAGVASR